MSCLSGVNRIFQFQIKSHLKNSVTIAIWSRDYSQKTASANNFEHQRSDNGPIGRLQKKIESAEFQSDEHQNRVMVELQKLFDTVQTYTPPEIEPNTSFFKWLPVKSSKKVKTPKGLYIHGSVGGGKTTLMDIFYESCNSVSKQYNLVVNVLFRKISKSINFYFIFRYPKRNEFILIHL